MYDIVCCIIFGFFMIIGISNTIYYLLESFFKFDNFDKESLTAENAEYILRSSKYCKNKYKINPSTNKNNEIIFIIERLINGTF